MALDAAIRVFRSRRMGVVFLLGFASGLPLMLVSGQTARTWMTDAGLSNELISAFATVGIAWTFKFLWAPVLDRYAMPFLGRRRGWLLVFQCLLAVGLATLGFCEPAEHPVTFYILSFVVAFIAASHDIVIDAYNTDLLEPEERAAGSAVYVMGYRTAMLIAGSLALVLADHMPWRIVYLIMAALMAIGPVATLMAEEPPDRGRPLKTLTEAVYVPFVELFRRLGWRGFTVMLLFAVLYKFGEQFAQVMTPTFFRGVIGFTKTEIGVVQKAVGFAAFAIGGAIGGGLVARFGLRKMLVTFGILQATTHLAYLWIAYAGKDLTVYGVGIFIENLSFAMATSAFVAALMGVASSAVSATQIALLSSLSSVGERVFGRFAGGVVDSVGWTGFFLTTIGLAIPGIVLAWWAGKLVEDQKPR
jgi:PAT family beta-lactamase induction signal transducer AmpG